MYVNVAAEEFNKLSGPAGVEMSMQYLSCGLWGVWERLKGDLVVQLWEWYQQRSVGRSEGRFHEVVGEVVVTIY